MTAADPRDAIPAIAASVGVGAQAAGGLERALAGALEALVAATGTRAAAFFAGAPGEPGALRLRARAGDAGAVAPGALTDRAVMVPAVVDGRREGTLALVPADGATPGEAALATARAAAGLIALGIRDAGLVRGLADRARALDRQAAALGALTRVARRLAEAQTAAAAGHVTVSEARALARADAAVLLAPEDSGPPREVARDGDAPVPADPADVAAAAAGAPPARRGPVAVVGVPPLALAVARGDGEPVADEDVEALAGLAAQASVALARGRLVDDLRREQAERRALAAAIVSAQEEERRRVAEDIHDGPVQSLSAVGLMLDALVAGLRDAAPEAAGDAGAAAAAAREAVRGLRRAIADLHPMALGELGFGAAARAQAERLEWRGIDVQVDVAAADALPDTARTVAFRVLQEAVANVLRHAEATRVAITARAEGDAVVLEVRDDGRGFAADAPRPGVAEGHLGLAAIEERAALAGGRLDVESAEGRGTLLRLTLPAGEGDAQAGSSPPSRPSAAESASSSGKRSSTTT